MYKWEVFSNRIYNISCFEKLKEIKKFKRYEARVLLGP